MVAHGHLEITTERGERTYVLAARTDAAAEPPVLDWRSAPLAGVFFRHRAGEAFELEVGEDRLIAGTVRARWLEGHTRVTDGPGPSPAPTSPRDQAAIVLDADQQRAVDLPADTSLVCDGEAGVGKTLVALYRVARLQRRAKDKGRRFRALVLVPTEGLRRLVKILAERQHIEKLEIAVFEEWLAARAHAAFPGLPKRLSEGATSQVIAIKRHPALRTVLPDFIGWKAPRDNDDKLPRSRARLLHLFGDRDRLQRVVDASGGQLAPSAIAQTMAHTRMQFEQTTERAHRHVDSDRLVALDGKRLDAGTPMEDAHTFDFEDISVLFELVRIGAMPPVELPDYDHIVVDEAQLRSPLELAAVGDALAKHGTVTLAGDHRQATDESAYFTDWVASRAELRRDNWEAITLAITYRSVPAIAEVARSLALPPDPPPDPAVWATAAEGGLAQAALLCWHLDALIARDPWRQIAVIARTPEHARRLHAELSRGLDPQLVLDGDFAFTPGLVVTTAAAVSGLEFDAVIIPDLAPGFYPVTPELQRALYVAATRARDFLWLLTPEAWSPLVTPATP